MQDKENETVHTLSQKISNWRLLLFVLAISLPALYFWYFGMHLKQEAAIDASKWGEFGDFFGGILNPLVAFAAFYWLTKSVKLQKTELEAARKILADTSKAQNEAAQAQAKAAELNEMLLKVSILNTLAKSAHDETEMLITQLNAEKDQKLSLGAALDVYIDTTTEHIRQMQEKVQIYSTQMRANREELQKLLALMK